ncbi:hypothetical protein SAY86_013485 [Trapa natans]|uniref:Uncharacterized protein n=1 Tax=Trapa natans TaxID=22666 RepID=A0AAN7QQK0_TRANT|nr:hypothetical protein SAY86_013485 [Trapa natans]
MVLPQFGIHTPVRVCANCYNKSSVSVKGVTQTSAGVNQVSDAVARLDIHADIDSRAENIPCHQPFPSIMECRCGMPLCICEPTVHPGDAIPQQGISANVQPIQKPNKIEIPRNRGITNNKSLHISTTGQEMDSNSENLKMDYEANGEGLREAIKNDDIAAVKKLLKEGVNANYRDKQRMSLLHLAAVFNRTDIAFILMDCGASTDYQNAQGSCGYFYFVVMTNFHETRESFDSRSRCNELASIYLSESKGKYSI